MNSITRSNRLAASSASWLVTIDIDAVTSAKRTVTCLRSPGSSGRDAPGSTSPAPPPCESAVPASRLAPAKGSPQNGQNRAFGGATSRQDPQRINDPRKGDSATSAPVPPAFDRIRGG